MDQDEGDGVRVEGVNKMTNKEIPIRKWQTKKLQIKKVSMPSDVDSDVKLEKETVFKVQEITYKKGFVSLHSQR